MERQRGDWAASGIPIAPLAPTESPTRRIAAITRSARELHIG
ncbi:hypothetical protein BSIN_0935 [Burkholderia singularis]|uniref:Uncharacterized protein n=1 Tax=Burkholderia singularis TaxID=1503053 RepID=A0A238HB84_9BURK|nr:hypothetical protein BSIN_0935 [Burkholderia singularis]